jgi:hypothetical protein
VGLSFRGVLVIIVLVVESSSIELRSSLSVEG